MLEGIVNMKNIVAFYVYDTYTVTFISICCVAIYWTENISSVFHPVNGYMHDMNFFRLNRNGD